MTPTDTTARSQTESLSFEFDLHHLPEQVWRALTDPELLAEWLLPVVDLKLEPGAAFAFKTQPYPGWDGTVHCRFLEIEAQRKLSYTWVVGDMDTVVTFTLTPTALGTRGVEVGQSGLVAPRDCLHRGGVHEGRKAHVRPGGRHPRPIAPVQFQLGRQHAQGDRHQRGGEDRRARVQGAREGRGGQ